MLVKPSETVILRKLFRLRFCRQSSCILSCHSGCVQSSITSTQDNIKLLFIVVHNFAIEIELGVRFSGKGFVDVLLYNSNIRCLRRVSYSNVIVINAFFFCSTTITIEIDLHQYGEDITGNEYKTEALI